MEIKQKHGKHALRKAVTAAVLAGTAFSSLGGFAGAVTTVKADTSTSVEMEELIRLVAEKGLSDQGRGRKSEEILKELREVLSSLSPETLKKLVTGFDDGRYDYRNSTLNTLANLLRTFRSENGYIRTAISLRGLLVDEIIKRVEKENEISEELIDKNQLLKDKDEKIQELSEEKSKVEKEVEEKQGEINKKRTRTK